MQLWNLLSGVKTYVCAIALGIAGILMVTGKITQAQFNSFAVILGPLALAALRAALPPGTLPPTTTAVTTATPTSTSTTTTTQTS